MTLLLFRPEPGLYDLTFLAGNDRLTVNGGDDTIAHMDEGNDTVTVNALNSGTATIYGGLGNDIYNVNVSGVTLIENGSEGTDLVQASVSYVLGANVENLTSPARPRSTAPAMRSTISSPATAPPTAWMGGLAQIF